MGDEGQVSVVSCASCVLCVCVSISCLAIEHQPIVRNIRNRFRYRLSVSFVLRINSSVHWTFDVVRMFVAKRTNTYPQENSLKFACRLCSISLIIRIERKRSRKNSRKEHFANKSGNYGLIYWPKFGWKNVDVLLSHDTNYENCTDK